MIYIFLQNITIIYEKIKRDLISFCWIIFLGILKLPIYTFFQSMQLPFMHSHIWMGSLPHFRIPASILIIDVLMINVWEHPTGQTHNPYSFGRHGKIPRSNTQSLLLRPNSSNSYSFGRTAPVLTPSARQSFLRNPCSNDAVFILTARSSWR
jgi:hypothetical protein